MREDASGGVRSDVRNAVENINVPSDRIAPCLFSLDVNIEELAQLAADGCTNHDDLQSFIADADELGFRRSTASADFSGTASACLFSLMRMQFYKCVGQQSGARLFEFTAPLLGRRDAVMAQALGKIAYVQSPAADGAFLQFSSSGTVSKPKAVYFNGFPDVCEEVYNGLCEYCILPIENSRDGKLRGFCALIDKYELQIECVCDVPSPDRSVTTGVALLRKRGFDSAEQILKPPADGFIEISIQPGGRLTVTDVLNAAEFCKLDPIAVDSVPDADGMQVINVRFPLKGADLPAFLLFLAFDTPQCNIVGLFRKIRTK